MTNVDPAAFRDFEFQGWQKVANRYHDSFATVTIQCIDALLDAAEVHGGSRTLDIATGPGYAAGRAAERNAVVTGIDFSSQMIEEARKRYLSIDFQIGDAESLSFPDSSFDAAIMNFGMLHLGRPDRAAAEACRVLHDNARFAFSVWDSPDKTLGFGIVLEAIRKHGDMNVPLTPGPPFFRFSDPAEASLLLTQAGFEDVQVRRVPQTWRLTDPDRLFDIMMNASVRNAALLQAQRPEVLESIRREIHTRVSEHQVSEMFELPMPAVLYFGRKHAGVQR
jgi:SAM-dependent methyltransferase